MFAVLFVADCYRKKIKITKKMSKSVLFTSAKNDRTILEWTIHHLTLGFDHIHIFQPTLSTVLDSLVEADNRVTIQQETPHEQMRDIAQTLGADWMLYLDSDEFVVLNNSSDVSQFLRPYAAFEKVGLNSLMFRSGEEGEETLIGSCMSCNSWLSDVVKTFVNLKCCTSAVSVYANFKPFTGFTYATDVHYEKASAYIANYNNTNVLSREIEYFAVSDKYNKTNKALMAKHKPGANFELNKKYLAASCVNEHVQVLRKYARECNSVLELNVEGNERTYGLLKGLSESKHTLKTKYYGNPDPALLPILQVNNMEYRQDIVVDLVVLTTLSDLTKELRSKVFKYIIVVDAGAAVNPTDVFSDYLDKWDVGAITLPGLTVLSKKPYVWGNSGFGAVWGS